jgi:hypothetical protein
MVNGLLRSLPTDALKSDRDQIEHALKMLAARQSVGSACRSKIKRLIGHDKAKFEAIYGLAASSFMTALAAGPWAPP